MPSPIARLLFVPFAALALAVPHAVQAQEESVTLTLPAPSAQPFVFDMQADKQLTVTSTSDQAWLDTKIDVSIKDATILDAIKKIVETAKASYDRVEPAFTLPETRLSLEMKNIPARDALAAVARLGGAVAYVGKDDKSGDKAVVWLRQRTESVAGPVIFTDSRNNKGMVYSVNAAKQIDQAMALANKAVAYTAQSPFLYTTLRQKSLPDRRVSLDKRDIDIRDALKDVLKQADCGYSLDADIPDNVKKSFTFEDIPIATALDVICDSAGIGWRSESTTTTITRTLSTSRTTKTESSSDKNDKSDKDDKKVKPTVLVARKYATHP